MFSRAAPKDWQNPDWDNCGKVHEWKNYASPWLREYWSALSDEGKKCVSATLDDIAASEEWE